MSEVEPPPTAAPADSAGMASVMRLLEGLDNLFHVIVAVLFILMAASVLAHTCLVFARHAPLILPRHAAAQPPTVEAGSGSELKPVTAAPTAEASGSAENYDPFLRGSLETLSSILFIVIILELLRTILTYLQTHNIQAIMREFVVVGIISSVRKILLVGAESSLKGSKGMEFIQEAAGTLLTILGILALIVGLWMLERSFGSKKAAIN